MQHNTLQANGVFAVGNGHSSDGCVMGSIMTGRLHYFTSGACNSVSTGENSTLENACQVLTTSYYHTGVVDRCFSVILLPFCSGADYTTSVYTLNKASGTFSIKHPDPSKSHMRLLHSFVETPTQGDNLYKYKTCVENCQSTIELPTYYKHLNCNDHVHLSPINHFGKAYGVVDSTQTYISVCADTDGEYDVILIGTRKDIGARNVWKGPENINEHNKNLLN